jgi:predicted dehydrogenase
VVDRIRPDITIVHGCIAYSIAAPRGRTHDRAQTSYDGGVMTRLPVCLVGCGGMGRRHLRGYLALQAIQRRNLDLVAVCDIDPAAADRLADEADNALGRRPATHSSIDDVLADPAVAALDVVTDPNTHHEIAVPALTAGKHVLCEKPLALTVRAARAMIDAANSGGAILATAENYRRGPGSRIARSVVKSGLLGQLHLMIEMHLGGNSAVLITPWRHVKERGAIGLDMGVHLTDMVQFLLGDIETVYGRGLIAEPVRVAADGQSITASGEDSLLAQLTMASGVTVMLNYLPSGPGRHYFQRTLHGRDGSVNLPADRSGGPVEVFLADTSLRGAQLLGEVGGSPVDDLTAELFGTRTDEYDLQFADSDAAHLAVELHDFADAVITGRPPEVDGAAGLSALAAVYSIFESGQLGVPVRVADVVSGAVHGYQDEIDEFLGLGP